MEISATKPVSGFGDFKITGDTKIRGGLTIYTLMALANLSFETILVMPAGGLLKIAQDIESGCLHNG